MKRTRTFAITATLALGLSACTLGGGADDQPTPAPTTTDREGEATADAGSDATADERMESETETEDAPSTPTGDPGTVVLVAHDSFSLPDELFDQFTAETGYEVTVQAGGDAGEMTNQLVLTAGRPVGDAVFGIDNTFASRAVTEGVLAEYTPAVVPGSVQEHALPDGGAAYLTAVDYGDVCVNIDNVWFAERGIAPPSTLSDLTNPEYADLFVTPGASSSSPGLAFLLATVGEFGADGWQDYWTDLMANGAKVTSGWTDAYTVDFTAGGGDGDRPIVLSYASSPPFTIPEGGWEPTTSALLDTCFRQVEYAGVLEGASNPEGARALVDFLISPAVQEAIPDHMFMFPANAEVTLPEVWAQWAAVADDPIVVHPQQIEENRETWVREWADLATG